MDIEVRAVRKRWGETVKHKCPKCGHRFEDSAQQSKAAKARWKATSAEDRSSAASAAARARWKTKKATGPQNVEMKHDRR